MKWKVGQQVYCLQNGEGVIIDTKNDGPYPIRVKFNGCESTYTELGKLVVNNENPMLYPSKPEIIVPKWQPQPGEWCWFWMKEFECAYLKRFEKMENGRYMTNKNDSYLNCAPFNGELPEHLKEVQP